MNGPIFLGEKFPASLPNEALLQELEKSQRRVHDGSPCAAACIATRNVQSLHIQIRRKRKVRRQGTQMITNVCIYTVYMHYAYVQISFSFKLLIKILLSKALLTPASPHSPTWPFGRIILFGLPEFNYCAVRNSHQDREASQKKIRS